MLEASADSLERWRDEFPILAPVSRVTQESS
jgi:hypothetical protein